ncbi:MAG: hypothetical protein E2577_11905 [Starkeya sp.]|nr:hypothetical protein [Starkeya sp.]
MKNPAPSAFTIAVAAIAGRMARGAGRPTRAAALASTPLRSASASRTTTAMRPESSALGGRSVTPRRGSTHRRLSPSRQKVDSPKLTSCAPITPRPRPSSARKARRSIPMPTRPAAMKGCTPCRGSRCATSSRRRQRDPARGTPDVVSAAFPAPVQDAPSSEIGRSALPSIRSPA